MGSRRPKEFGETSWQQNIRRPSKIALRAGRRWRPAFYGSVGSPGIENMTLKFREMERQDIPVVFEVRLSTVENVVTMEELEEDYGIMNCHGFTRHSRTIQCS